MGNPINNPGPIKITLTVEAASLYGANLSPNVPSTTIDNACTLKDDNPNDPGSSPTGKIEDFTSQVYIDNNVTWVGEVKDKNGVDKGYSVAIDSIVYEPKDDDKNFFSDTTINGSGGRSGNVIAKVNKDNSLIGKLDIYRINFSIYPPGSGNSNARGPFPIDPKLQGNS